MDDLMTDRDALRDEIAAVCLAHLKPPKFAGGSWTLNPADCADSVLAVVEPALEAARNDAAHLERVTDEARHNESKARAALAQRDAEIDRLRDALNAVLRGTDAMRTLKQELDDASLPPVVHSDGSIEWVNGRPSWFAVTTELFESLTDELHAARRRLAAVEALCDEWWGRATEATSEPLSWRRVCHDLRAALASGDRP